jgi:hypothetical protein
LHATYAKALAAVIPVISSASAHVRTSSGFAEKSFWKTSELRASDSPLGAPASPRRPALLSFALLFLFSRRLAFAGACGGVSGPLSAWTTSAMDSPNARITELCPWPAWWPAAPAVRAFGAGARGAHGGGVLGEVGNACEERRERPRVARVGDVRRELAQAPRHGFAHGLTVMCVFFVFRVKTGYERQRE